MANQFCLSGKIAGSERKEIGSNGQMTKLRIAFEDKKYQDGYWITVTAIGIVDVFNRGENKLADMAARLPKGSAVVVTGRLKFSNPNPETGSVFTNCQVTDIQVLHKPAAPVTDLKPANGKPQPVAMTQADDDQDIPF